MQKLSVKRATCVCIIFMLINFVYSSTGQGSEPQIPALTGGIAWSADDTTLAVGTTQGVFLHNTINLSIVSQHFPSDRVTALTSHPNEPIFAFGTQDGQLVTWNTTDESYQVRGEQGEAIVHLHWSFDGNRIISMGFDTALYVWDLTTGVRYDYSRQGFARSEVSCDAGCVHFIATDTNQGRPVLSIGNTETMTLSLLLDPPDYIFPLQWNPTRNVIAGGGRNHVWLWDAETGQLISTIDSFILNEAITDPIAIDWSPNGRYLAIAVSKEGLRIGDYSRNVIEVWDFDRIDDPALSTTIENSYHHSSANVFVSWDHAGDRLAATGADGHIYIWNADTFALLDEYSGYRNCTLNLRDEQVC